MRQGSIGTYIKILLFSLLVFLFVSVTDGQESKVSRRKIEREKAKKERQALKDYNRALKQHQKNQTSNTKVMMKRARKDAPKTTPLKPASGKKCK